MQIIGLSGYARSGKDETAKVLVDEFGFTRVAFADKLREVLYQLNPIVAENGMLLQDVIDKHGWDGYKQTRYGAEIRRLLQRLGTEAGRQTLGENIWVDATLTGFEESAKIVVTDCRFPNEARAIRERDGVLVRVTREGIGPTNDHPSETSLDNWKFDYGLTNDGTLDEYHQHVRDFYNALDEMEYMRNVIGL